MKKEYIFMIIFITSLSLGIIGLSYSWFSTKIMGNESAKDIIVDADEIKLIYTDTTPLLLSDAMPGDTITKTFTVENTGSSAAEYQIKWKNLINEFKAGELKISLTCISKDENDNVSGTCESIEDKMVPYTETQNDYKIKDNIEIDTNITHEYTLTLEFVEKNKEQDYNQAAHFEGKINITKANQKPVNNCTFDGNLTQGAEYTNGQYTYRYMQEYFYDYEEGFYWSDIDADGWGATLTDYSSTDPVTTPLCTSINGKPIASMSHMFFESQATTLDLSSFDTSNVTNMYGMFDSSQATTLDLSNFDTSKVTNMDFMFGGSQANTLDLSSFDTSNVTKMNQMFYYSEATTIDLRSFDTNNVTEMIQMFGYSQATTLDLSSFDTSHVTIMNWMFECSQATTLDLSSFDTSNVINMSYMFYGSMLEKIYVSDKWNTSSVTSSSNMFYNVSNLKGGSGTTYNSSNPSDKTYAHVDGGVSNPGYFTYKAN